MEKYNRNIFKYELIYTILVAKIRAYIANISKDTSEEKQNKQSNLKK